MSSVTYDLPTDQSFAYEYDDMGNIDTYTDANGTVTYTYDDLGQLLSASNGYTYSYDNAGNILSANGHTYTYGDSSWADLLTAVDGEAITYDAIGNPTSYYNGTSWSFDWARGRQLVSAENDNVRIDYTYDADGLRTSKTVTSPLDNSQKNGLFVDSDGETRYYVDGVAAYAGLVYWDGYFYYFNSSLKAVRNRTYWPTNTNGLIPVAEYTFDENGRITNPPVVGIDAQGQLKNGIYADADGEIRYYVNGIATYAKLVYFNGHYYYIDSSLKAVRDTTYYVTHPNGLMAAGNYTFDAQGRMIDPPEDALTEAISTFALTGETMSKTYAYVYASGKLMRQVLTVTIGNSTTTYAMDFFYDTSGYPFAVKYNGDLCYYITNLQGDVMSIVDPQGEVVAEYEYDPYGNIVSQSGPLAEANPLRYRGYVFDTESGLYYLQSRYYDPEMGRFINADAYASTGQGVLGNNMFAYCRNNPINMSDYSGHWPQWLEDKLEELKEWLEEKKEEASSNEDITLVIGGTASGAFGIAGSVSRGITIDTEGNVGRITTTTGGGGFPSAGAGLFISINNTPTIFAQEGLGTTVGASGGPWAIAVGGDYNMIVDTKNAKTYHGGTLTVSYGFYPTFIEIHGEVGYSWVEGFNLYDAAIKVVDFLLIFKEER